MNRRKDRDEPEDQERREHDGQRRPRGTGYGRERGVYLAYLLERWQGSPPPTADAYARALRQWRQLPGAQVTEPADISITPEHTEEGRS